MFTDPVTGEKVHGIATVRYSHKAMIDMMIASPSIRQNELAAYFDRSPSWISSVINSDSFQAALSERKAEIEDPVLTANVQERLRAVADASLVKILDKLSGPLPSTDDFLVKTAKLATDALGYGARPQGGSNTNVAVIVQIPPKMASATEWSNKYAAQ